jgi:Icc-related predicted phosphoesterase
LNCIFASDLHGKIKRYESLFNILLNEIPDAVFLGGDLLPNQFTLDSNMDEFIEDKIFSNIKRIINEIGKKIRFFIILGNDDPRMYESFFKEADRKGLIDYVHNKTVNFADMFVTGYSHVPPTPFQLKDWEKYDVSRYVDVGVVPPEAGIRTIEVSEDKIRYATIAEDLKKLYKNAPMEKTIFLFHSPPYNSYLDRADLDGKIVDHAPIDVHIGSIAIQRFIKKEQPLLTLHGHVHESARITGYWKERFGKTYSFNASHDGTELALVRFKTDDLENATRELIEVS